MLRPTLRHTLALTVALSLAACDGTVPDEQRFFNDRALFDDPAGYTRVTDTGETVATDADDWRVGPGFGTRVLDARLLGPNPLRSSQTASIRLDLTQGVAGRLALYVVTARGDLVPVVQLNPPDTSGPGFPIFQVSGSDLSPSGQAGLYRVVLADDRLNVVTYGDLLLDP